MFKHEHAKIIWLLESEVARAHQKNETHTYDALLYVTYAVQHLIEQCT